MEESGEEMREPKMGETFLQPIVDPNGEIIGFCTSTIEQVYPDEILFSDDDEKERLFQVVPYDDDTCIFEIKWSEEKEGWVVND